MLIKLIIKSKFRSRPSAKLKYNVEIMNWYYKRGYKKLAKLYNRKILYKFNIDIGPGVVIPFSTAIPHIVGIVIGRGVKIDENVTILQNVTIGSSLNSSLNGSHETMPTIERDVMILAGAVLAGKITIGHNSIVAANAVVTTDVPPNSLVVGFNKIKSIPEKYRQK